MYMSERGDPNLRSIAIAIPITVCRGCSSHHHLGDAPFRVLLHRRTLHRHRRNNTWHQLVRRFTVTLRIYGSTDFVWAIHGQNL